MKLMIFNETDANPFKDPEVCSYCRRETLNGISAVLARDVVGADPHREGIEVILCPQCLINLKLYSN